MAKKSTKINILFTITHGIQELTSLQDKRQKTTCYFQSTHLSSKWRHRLFPIRRCLERKDCNR